jgi:solute:Na+ symporter, SSS family
MTEVPHLLKGFLIVAILSAAMSSVSSALTSLASVSTMDFVKHLLPGRSEGFFLRFSKASTVVWAIALIYTAYMSRQVPFVLNAAFALRGLTSGALVGGLALAVFWKKGRGAPVIIGMLVSLGTMTGIQVLPKLDCTKALWLKVVGTEVFWPWYTLIGATITLLAAWLVRKMVLPLLQQSADLGAVQALK